SPAEVYAEHTGPRQWGSVFALVWLFYLLNPLEAGWEQRDTASGWVGVGATLVFAGIYAAVFLGMRRNRPMGTPFRATVAPWAGPAVIALEVLLGIVICVAVGQPG